jgi:hypothetical protein
MNRLTRLVRWSRAAFRVLGRGVWAALADERGRFDVAQAGLLVGLGLVWYGLWQVHEPSAFLVPGAILVWLFLPSRPSFFGGQR